MDLHKRDAAWEAARDEVDRLEHPREAQLVEHQPRVGRTGRERVVGLDAAHEVHVRGGELSHQPVEVECEDLAEGAALRLW